MAKVDADVVRSQSVPTSWARDALARLGVSGTEATGEPEEVVLRRRGAKWTVEVRWAAKVVDIQDDMRRRVLHERLKAARARERGEIQ